MAQLLAESKIMMNSNVLVLIGNVAVIGTIGTGKSNLINMISRLASESKIKVNQNVVVIGKSTLINMLFNNDMTLSACNEPCGVDITTRSLTKQPQWILDPRTGIIFADTNGYSDSERIDVTIRKNFGANRNRHTGIITISEHWLTYCDNDIDNEENVKSTIEKWIKGDDEMKQFLKGFFSLSMIARSSSKEHILLLNDKIGGTGAIFAEDANMRNAMRNRDMRKPETVKKMLACLCVDTVRNRCEQDTVGNNIGDTGAIFSEKMRNPETVRNMQAVLDSVRKSVCIVKLDDRVQGIGAIYRVTDCKNTCHPLFITCNHVLPIKSLDETSHVVLEFNDIQQLKNFSLSKNDVKDIWTSEVLNATIVEISSEVERCFKSAGITFLKVDQIANKSEVAILQYPNGRFRIAFGEIYNKNGNELFYQIGSAQGSSGSPLFNWDCKALAMHNAGLLVNGSEQRPEFTHRAIALTDIIDAYLVNSGINDLQIKGLDLTDNSEIIMESESADSEPDSSCPSFEISTHEPECASISSNSNDTFADNSSSRNQYLKNATNGFCSGSISLSISEEKGGDDKNFKNKGVEKVSQSNLDARTKLVLNLETISCEYNWIIQKYMSASLDINEIPMEISPENQTDKCH